jgi:hypothetical protein
MYDTNVASSLTFHDPELELASVGVLIFPTRQNPLPSVAQLSMDQCYYSSVIELNFRNFY